MTYDFIAILSPTLYAEGLQNVDTLLDMKTSKSHIFNNIYFRLVRSW